MTAPTSVTRAELADVIRGTADATGGDLYVSPIKAADAILAKYIVLPKAVQPERPKRELLTEPHNGHPVDESCPGCPHEQPKLDPKPWRYDDEHRYAVNQLGSYTEFKPGPEYDQDPTHYPQEGTR